MNNAPKKPTPVWQCVVLMIVGVILLIFGLWNLANYFEDVAEKQNMEVQWFDLYSESEELQGLEFMLISDAFAEYTYGTSQGFYIVFDDEMYGYIICMEQDRLAEEFQANYDYTFTDIETVQESGYVEGYAVEIDEEIKEYAIEYFNFFWGEEVMDESNFYDYLGAYYLDTTIEPETENTSIATEVVSIALGILLLIVGICKLAGRGKRIKAQEQWEKEQREKEIQQAFSFDSSNPYMTDMGTVGEETKAEEVRSESPEVQEQGNIAVALIASVICASIGAVLWVVIYKLGYIAGITGCVAAVGALFGYEKIGKRQVSGGAIVWCIFVSLVVLLLGNAVAYAWEFTEAFDSAKADFFVVLGQLPSILDEYDCIGSFFGDWGMGVFFAAISGFSIGNRKK